MKNKRTIVAIVAVTITITSVGLVAALATGSGAREIRKAVKAVLTPDQIQTLMEFKDEQAGEFHKKHKSPADKLAIWRELDMTAEQQDKMLDVIDTNIDDIGNAFEAVAGTGTALRKNVIAGDPDDKSIRDNAAQLGKDIGEAAIVIAYVHAEGRTILTSEQIAIAEAKKAEHRAEMQAHFEELPERVDAVVALWTELSLTPEQIEGLSGLHGMLGDFMKSRHEKNHAEFREDLEDILTYEQLAVADAFHEERGPEFKARHEQLRQAKREFVEKLGLTGEQKIALVELAIEKREGIEIAIRLVAETAGTLHDRVTAETIDEASIRIAANQLADAIGLASALAADYVKDAKGVLSTDQIEMISIHMEKHDTMMLDHIAGMPVKVQGFLGFIDELDLSEEQRNEIFELIAEKHEERHAKFMRMN